MESNSRSQKAPEQQESRSVIFARREVLFSLRQCGECS